MTIPLGWLGAGRAGIFFDMCKRLSHQPLAQIFFLEHKERFSIQL